MHKTLRLALLFTFTGSMLGADVTFNGFLKQFRSFKTLQAQFTQELNGLSGTQSAKGSLWVKRPAMMKWEYSVPEKNVFILEKKRTTFYQPDENQVQIRNLDPDELEHSPLLFLLGGKRDLTEFFLIQNIGDSPGQSHYLLLPRDKNIPFSRVVLLLAGDPPFIAEITLYEDGGNFYRYTFHQVEFDRVIPDALFRFTPPPGAEVLHRP